jgi:uncharacterized protein YsxB (DUF464 family)
MTKQRRSSNDKDIIGAAVSVVVRALVIWISFVIRHSDFVISKRIIAL